MGCTKTRLIPSNPSDNNNTGNINIKDSIEDGLDCENNSSGTECCLCKIEKLAIPARVALLQSTNIWVGDLGASTHFMNNRCRGSNIHEGSIGP